MKTQKNILLFTCQKLIDIDERLQRMENPSTSKSTDNDSLGQLLKDGKVAKKEGEAETVEGSDETK
jgi:hypothetical protein